MREYNTEQKPGETLEHYYRRLAKVADQRLVRLEELGKQEGYQGAVKWAYLKATEDAQYWGGYRDPKAPRFNTKPPADAAMLKAKISDIQEFLKAPTSTKAGIVEVYKKRAEAFNKNHGTNFTWNDWAMLLTRYGDLYENYDSAVLNKAFAVVQSMKTANPKMSVRKIKSAIKTANEGDQIFNYVKSDGTDGKYDKHVDMVLRDIFSNTSKIEDLYRLMVGGN